MSGVSPTHSSSQYVTYYSMTVPDDRHSFHKTALYSRGPDTDMLDFALFLFKKGQCTFYTIYKNIRTKHKFYPASKELDKYKNGPRGLCTMNTIKDDYSP